MIGTWQGRAHVWKPIRVVTTRATMVTANNLKSCNVAHYNIILYKYVCIYLISDLLSLFPLWARDNNMKLKVWAQFKVINLKKPAYNIRSLAGVPFIWIYAKFYSKINWACTTPKAEIVKNLSDDWAADQSWAHQMWESCKKTPTSRDRLSATERVPSSGFALMVKMMTFPAGPTD